MQSHLPEYFLGDLVATVAFGIVAILLIIVGYIAFDKLTPKLDFDDLLNKGNLALAIVIGSFIHGLCYVVGGAGSGAVTLQNPRLFVRAPVPRGYHAGHPNPAA